jgi:chromosome segregation ATPase
MKIAKIRISNLLGIDEMEFALGDSVTAVVGPNGSGKTSIIEAIRAVVGSGHDATLLRKGAEKGEAVIELEDGSEIGMKVSSEKSDRYVRDSHGSKQSSPLARIRGLIDLMAANPVSFLTASKKERAQVLLESMPMEADAARIKTISGIEVVTTDLHALDAIEGVRKTVFDDRTGTNRAIREKEATINQLRASIGQPADKEAEPVDVEATQKALNEKEAIKNSRIEKIEAHLAGIVSKNNSEIEGLRAKIQELQKNTADSGEKASAAKAKVMEEYNADKAHYQAIINRVREVTDRLARHKQAVEFIAKSEAEVGELEGDAKRMTKAIDDLDAYKAELLASLPIPGLEVRDGDVFFEGVPFDRVNEAKRVSIAVDVAKLRIKEVPLVFVDGIEALDSKTFKEFCTAAAAAGLQMIVSKVTDGEKLKVVPWSAK